MFTKRVSGLALVLGLFATALVGSSPFAQVPGPGVFGVDTSLPIPAQPPAAPPSALLQKYATVSADRLKNPAAADWLMTRRTYDGWGYSPLEEINPGNVTRLQPVWTMSTGMNNGHEAAPIVNGGVMFVTSSFNQVLALDAKTGALLWRYRSESSGSVRGKPVNRGVTLYGNKVFVVLTEAVLVALDAKTGKEVWRSIVGNNATGEYLTAPPLVADGRLVTGISGGDGPNRGFVAA